MNFKGTGGIKTDKNLLPGHNVPFLREIAGDLLHLVSHGYMTTRGEAFDIPVGSTGWS